MHSDRAPRPGLLDCRKRGHKRIRGESSVAVQGTGGSAWVDGPQAQRLPVLLLTVLTLLLLLGSTTAFIAHERLQALAQASALAERRVDRLASDLSQTLAIARLAIAQTRREAAPAGTAEAQDLMLARRTELLAALPLPFTLRAPGAGDPDGSLASAAPVLAGAPGRWQVGSVQGPPGARHLPLVWRDGRPASLVVDLSHQALQQRFESDRLADGGGVALFRIEPDGAVHLLVRAPFVQAEIGKTVRGPLVRALAAAPSGVFDDVTLIDGQRRIVAYRRLPGEAAALVVAYGMATDGVLAAWSTMWPRFLAVALLLAAGVAWGGWRLDRSLREMARSHRALAQSEQHWRSLADNLPDVVVRVDRSGRYHYANAAIGPATGLTPAAAVGRSAGEAGLDSGSLGRWQAGLQALFNSGQPQRLEVNIEGPDGSRPWEVLLVLEPARGDQQPMALAISRDISERRRAESALRASEQRFRLAASFGQVWEWDIASGRVNFPDRFWQALDLTPPTSATARAAVGALLDDEGKAAWQRAMVAHLRDRRPFSMSFDVTDAQGRRRVFQTQGQAIWNDAGRATYMAGTTFEITEQRIAEDALRSSQARLSYLLSSAPTVIYSAQMQADFGATYYSPNLPDLLGWQPEQFIRAPTFWLDKLHPQDREPVLAQLAELPQRGELVLEYRFAHADGRWRWMRDAVRLMPDKAGGPAEIVGSLIDITDRRQAETDLRASERRFRLAASFGQVWEWDIDGGRANFPDAFWQGLGHATPPPERSIAALEALFADDDRVRRHAELAARLQDGGPGAMQMALRDASGELRWFQAFGQAERDAAGRAFAMVGTIFEITEQHRALAALRDSEQLLRHFFESDLLGLAITEPDRRWAQFNARLCEMLGYDEAQLRQRDWTTLTHPDDLAADLAQYTRVLAGEIDGYRMDKRYLRGDGTVLDAAIAVHCQRSADGRPLRFYAIIEDAGARRQTEARLARQRDDMERMVGQRTEELARSEARQRAIFETVPVAIAEEDWSGVQQLLRGLREQGLGEGADALAAHLADRPDLVRQCLAALRVLRRNRSAIGLAGTPGDAASAPASPFPGRDDSQQFIDELAALWTGQRLYSCKRSLVAADGTARRLMLTVALPALDDADGTALVCGADISEIDRLNTELDLNLQRLRQVNRELETFTYSVSHDLKAPLRGIDGYSRLLLSDHLERLDDEGRGFLQHIRQAAQQMGVLIDDLLAYSRLERRDLTLAALPLAALVDQVLQGYRPALAQRRAQLQLDLPEGLRVRGDAQGLTMSLRNLLDNALKFNDAHKDLQIRIAATRTQDGVQLTVQDNGLGFDMKFHDRIFAIFQRLHRAEDYPGTGIGLAIVRKAMERMGGRVWAESQPGRGTTFTLELPEAQ